MVGAKVDGKMVPISHIISMGEIIEIITTSQPGHGPSRDWLSIAKTSQARNKIRSWFKKERREENIEAGKADLEREFSRNGIRLSDEDMDKFIENIAKRQKCASVDDFYAALGFGGITLSKIMPRVKEDYNKMIKSSKPVDINNMITDSQKSSRGEGVIVEGIDNCLIKLSRCCDPLPGDEIIGFITRGHGVSIHKRDCNNVPRNLTDCEDPGRWISARWASNQHEFIKSNLQIHAVDRPALLADISIAIAGMRVPLHAVNARQTSSGNSVIDITISAEGVEHLKNICKRIEKISGVFSVDRSNI